MGCTIIKMKKTPPLTLTLQVDHEDDGGHVFKYENNQN